MSSIDFPNMEESKMFLCARVLILNDQSTGFWRCLNPQHFVDDKFQVYVAEFLWVILLTFYCTIPTFNDPVQEAL